LNAALTALVSSKGSFFFCDPYVNVDPSAEDIATMTMLAADKIRNFGMEPRAALLSHSNFGSHLTPSAQKMQKALSILIERAPDLAVEGEMHADSALSPEIRQRIFPNARFQGQANLLVMPNLDAANIAFNMVKIMADAQPVGPLLLGMHHSAHILTPSVTVRGIVNMAAFAVVDSQNQA
jgi:malate dehydrogenase (oxaloacetate-decarboxylating)(NADP+)